MLKRLWKDDEGVLTFEWIMLFTLLIIGVIGGVAGIRDAIIHEAQGSVGAITALDQTYALQPPLAVSLTGVNGDPNDCATSSSVTMSSMVLVTPDGPPFTPYWAPIGPSYQDGGTYEVGRAGSLLQGPPLNYQNGVSESIPSEGVCPIP